MEMSRRLATQEDIQAGLNIILILSPCSGAALPEYRDQSDLSKNKI